MLPTRSEVHVSQPLSNMSVAYQQAEDAFIHTKVFPQCPVLKQFDRYFTFPKDYWFRTQSAVRADGEESVGAGFHISNTPTYSCNVYAVHTRVGEQLRANAAGSLDIDTAATNFVTQQNMLKRELVFCNNYLKTGLWQGFATAAAPTVPVDFSPTLHSASAAQWDAANSTPISDIDRCSSRMLSQTGFKPNKLVLGDNVFRAVKNNPSVLDRIKYTQRGIITPDLLAPLFGVDEVLIAQGVVNTAAEAQIANMGFITGNKFLLAYAAPAPALMWPSAGYIFTWTGLEGSSALGSRVSVFPEPLRKADRIESEMAWDMNTVCTDLGILGVNVLANP